MKEIIVSQEKLKQLMENQYRFYSFKNKLENMSVEINKEYDYIYNVLNLLFEEQNQKEDILRTKNIKESILEDIVVSQENLAKLMSVEYRFYAFGRNIQNMSVELNKEYGEISNFVHELLKEQNEKEEKEHDIKFEMFETAGMENNLDTVWSIYEIDNLNDIFGYVDVVGYNGLIEFVGKEVTHLELWKVANKLILASEDYHHIFIENFEKLEDTDYFELQTGS